MQLKSVEFLGIFADSRAKSRDGLNSPGARQVKSGGCNGHSLPGDGRFLRQLGVSRFETLGEDATGLGEMGWCSSSHETKRNNKIKVMPEEQDDRGYTQEELDNHANQLNSNNDAYWQSRGENGRPEDDED